MAEKARVSTSRYLRFSRSEWARLRASTPLTLSEQDLETLRGINERVSLDEVSDVYLPLSRLLNLYVAAAQQRYAVADAFLGKPTAKVPYLVAIAGSVAVGKSTTSRILQALLARWPDHPRVDLVATDGFLFSNRELEEKELMSRKGFPESYDVRALVELVADLKAGEPELSVPVYSHVLYDIVAGQQQIIERPDILILEGLNVLQTGGRRDDGAAPRVYISDFIDFSIYVDAAESDIESWYVERFVAFRDGVFRDPHSYFHRFASLSDDEARATARRIWHEINARNLHENIEPTRERAHLILEKGADHSVTAIRLRKL